MTMDNISYIKFGTAPIPKDCKYLGIYDWVLVPQDTLNELMLIDNAEVFTNEDGTFVLFITGSNND